MIRQMFQVWLEETNVLWTKLKSRSVMVHCSISKPLKAPVMLEKSTQNSITQGQPCICQHAITQKNLHSAYIRKVVMKPYASLN